MKKITLFLMVIAMVSFWSCENTQTPMEPVVGTTGELSTFSNESNNVVIDSDLIDICEIDGTAYVIPSDDDCSTIDFSEYVLVNPQYTHFLIIIKEWVDEGHIEFAQDNMANAYYNKLDVLIKMLEAENFNGATHKGLNDVYKHTNTWITNENQRIAFNSMLEITQWMIDHPDEPIHTLLSIIKKVKKTTTYLSSYYTITCTTTDVWFLGVHVYSSTVCERTLIV